MMSLTPQWQRLSKWQQLVVFVIGSGAIIGVVYAVVLGPLWRWVSHLVAEVHQTEVRFVDAVAASRQADGVNKAFKAYAPYVTSSGPVEAELAGFLSEVEAALHQAGLVVLNLKPVTPREGDVETISVTVEGESSPGQLIQFLSAVQRSVRLLKVTELTIRTSSEGHALRSSMVISKLMLK